MKSLGNIILISSLLSFAFGCTNANDKDEIVLPLKGEEIYIDDDVDCGFILKVLSDTVYAETYGGGYLYQYTVIDNDTLIQGQNFSRRGLGSNEFFCASLGVRNNEAYIFGNSNGIMKTAKSDAEGNITMLSPLSLQKIAIPSSYLIVENDSTILLMVAPSIEPHNLFGKYNTNTGEFTPIKYWPDDDFTGAPHSKYRYYVDNSMFQSNGAGKYLYSLGNTNKAFIFSIINDSVVIEHSLYDSPVNYSADADGVNYKYKRPDNLLKVDSNDSIIVFLDRHLTADGNEPKKGEAGAYGNKVSVWDWDGNKIGEYELDHLVYAIFVNSNDNSFYGKSRDKDTGNDLIWRYRIK